MALNRGHLGSAVLRRALLGTAAVGLALAAEPALAQSASAPVATASTTASQAPQGTPAGSAQDSANGTTGTPDAQATPAQEVVVTGSLFRRNNTETASPVTVLSADAISKEGIVNISDAIRSVSADNSGTIPNALSPTASRRAQPAPRCGALRPPTPWS